MIVGSRYWLRVIEKTLVFRATRNAVYARYFRAAFRGLSAGCAWLPVSHISRFRSRGEDTLRLRWSRRIRRICRFRSRGEHTERGAWRCEQVRYSSANRRILISRRDSLRGSAMPTLLVAAPTDALRASERRTPNERPKSSWLHRVSSRDQDAVTPFAGPLCQSGVRRNHWSAPRMFRPRCGPSPMGEDRRKCRSIFWTSDRHHNKRFSPYRSLQTLTLQTIFSFSQGSIMHLGNAIKICRAHRGLTQAQLAKEAGISLSYLSLLEHDKRDANISTLESIARALGIPLNLLFFFASDGGELQGLPEDVRDRLSSVILRLLNESRTTQASLPLRPLQ